jgi:hypothetical protein
MEYARLVDVLARIPKRDLRAVVVSTFSLNAHTLRGVLDEAGIDEGITHVFHHRSSRSVEGQDDFFGHALGVYKWTRQAIRYYHWRFVLFVYGTTTMLVMYSYNLDKYREPDVRELVYVGTPRGVKELARELARLMRRDGFTRRNEELEEMLSHVRERNANDTLIVQRRRHPTTRSPSLARLGHRRSIGVYAPYESPTLEVCRHIADAVGGADEVRVGHPPTEHDFSMGSFVDLGRRMLLFTTHNLTDASWVRARTLEVSVLTSRVPRAVRAEIDSRMRYEADVFVTRC